MQISGRKALVFGAARSGVSSARFLAERGATVAIYDKKTISEWSKEAIELKEKFGVGFISEEIPSWLLDQIDLAVISPGVPLSLIPIRYLDRKGAEIIGEVELAARFLKGQIVGITGTNGKTTTTTLIGEILKDAGFKTLVGGNIGRPLIDLVVEAEEETITVAELSSFQLESIRHLHPKIAICLNVTPNHLDRYSSFSDYAAAKHRIFMNQERDDLAILSADNEITLSWSKNLKPRVSLFSVRRELEEGYFLKGEKLIERQEGKEIELIERSKIGIRGLHNIENALAALAAGRFLNADLNSMRQTLGKFSGVEHRIEFVAEIKGVRYFNDSKATSVDAAAKAIDAFADEKGKLIVIMGGRGKKAPYTPLREALSRQASAVIAIGEDAETIQSDLTGAVQVIRCSNLQEAVSTAAQKAKSGDIVLLAPACSSFDMFSDFEERGRVFKQIVGRLKAGSALGVN
jgi:UDP-N-acetylmuramoylalanine--D-glutamate ligase